MTPTDRAFVEDLPVRLLVELPAPATLHVRVTRGGDVDGWVLLLTTCRSRAEAAHVAGEPACTPLEYEALAAALELDACTPEHALEELARKRGPLGYRLAIAGLVGAVTDSEGRERRCPVHGPLLRTPGVRAAMREGELHWTIGRLLEALGAELLDAVVESGREA